MNTSVDREASFEVSKRKTSFNLSVEQEASFEVLNRLDDEDIMSASPTSDPAIPSAPMKNSSKPTESSSSPSKVMDFEQVVQSNEDLVSFEDSFVQWGVISEEDVEVFGQSDFTHIVDGSFASDGNENPRKVLFPDSDNSRENSLLASGEESESKDTSGLDENGFPKALDSSDQVDSPDVYSSSFIAFDEMNENEVDENENEKGKAKEEKSRWSRVLEKIPERTIFKATQVRKQLLRCHDAVGYDEDMYTVGETTIGGTTFGGATFKNDESMFSYGSFEKFSKKVLAGKQKASNTTSKSSTPMKTRTGCIAKKDNDDGNPYGSSMKLYIDLYQKAGFETLMSNLEGNALVQEVQIFRSWEEYKEDLTRSTDEIKRLFETIGSLPNLKTLNLANFLAEDVQLAAFGQWENKNLGTIRIHLYKGSLSQTLMASLARLPALRDLTLEMNQSFPFHLLLHSRKLQSLTIVGSGFEMENSHVMELVQVIPTNETLKKLTIEPDMKLRTFKLLVSSLSQNMGIQEFQFSLRPGSDGDTTRVMTELARTVTSNASLRIIRNLNHKNIEVEDKRACDALMKALTRNYIIEDFLVFHEKQWFKVRKNRILRDNKMEYIDSLLTKLFKCDNDARGNTGDSSNRSMRADLVKIGGTVKSEARRVASSALDLVGRMGIKK